MIEVVQTDVFRRWMDRLNDPVPRNRIIARIDRASNGTLGDWRSVGAALPRCGSIMGQDIESILPGAGIGWSFFWREGTKRTQAADIVRATEIAKQLEL